MKQSSERRCYALGFEYRGKSHVSRNAGGLYKLERAREQVLFRTLRKITGLPTSWFELSETDFKLWLQELQESKLVLCCATKFLFCYSIIWKLKLHYLSTFVAKSSPLEVYDIHIYKSLNSQFLFTIIEDPHTASSPSPALLSSQKTITFVLLWILSPRTTILLLSYLTSVFIQNSCLIT